MQALGTYSRNYDWKDPLTFMLDEVIKSPNSVRALTNLGYVLIDIEKKPSLALKPLYKAISLNPTDITVLNNLYSIYNNPPLKNEKAAESYLQRIFTEVKTNPNLSGNNNHVLHNLANHLFKKERYEESLLLLNKITKTQRVPAVYLHMGQCKVQLGEYNDAISLFKTALQLRPDSAQFIFNLAWTYQLAGDNIAAKKTLSTINLSTLQDKTLEENISKLQKTLSRESNKS
jgi:Flp pilus assembly protein TadD